MILEIFNSLTDWAPLDTWIVLTASLAAMACALPGAFLLLRRQSMMGDALSHTMLLGIVLGFLTTHGLYASGWISGESYLLWRHLGIFVGAILVGLLSAILTQAVIRIGRVEPSAALGVVFTGFFALGLILMRVAADNVDIDPDCVLYGTIETVVMETYGNTPVPIAAIVCGSILLVNLLLVALFFKELQICTFDPQMAESQGIPSSWIQYAMLGMTAVTLVAAFESVGSILVIAMLIVPGATASLLTDRFGRMLGLSLLVAALSSILGHAMAISVPGAIFRRLGYPEVRDASTAGMMALASGLLLLVAMLLAPRYGLLSKWLNRFGLRLRIAREDVLGILFRGEEIPARGRSVRTFPWMKRAIGAGQWTLRIAVSQLARRRMVVPTAEGYHLTEEGRLAASRLVRSHRLWESYMLEHFQVPEDHLHPTAERVEHYIDQEVREQLAAELEQPDVDPHGQRIPGETDDE